MLKLYEGCLLMLELGLPVHVVERIGAELDDDTLMNQELQRLEKLCYPIFATNGKDYFNRSEGTATWRGITNTISFSSDKNRINIVTQTGLFEVRLVNRGFTHYKYENSRWVNYPDWKLHDELLKR